MLRCTVLRSTVLRCTVLRSTVLRSTVLRSTVLRSTASTLLIWGKAVRLPFSTAIIVPVLFAAALAAEDGHGPPLLVLALVLGGGIAIHLGANLLNDFFDHRSGVDDGNPEPLTPLAGGSRVIQEGQIPTRHILLAGCLLIGTSLTIGIALGIAHASLWWLALLVVGGLLAIGYSAPPIAGNYRRIGEIFIFLAFGALPVFCGYFLLTGAWSTPALARSLPIAFAVTAIVYVAEFPDRDADRRGGKHTLPAALPHRAAAWGYVLLQAAALGSLVWLCLAGWLPPVCLVGLLAALPMAYAAAILLGSRRSSPPARFRPAIGATIGGHLLLGGILIVGCWI